MFRWCIFLSVFYCSSIFAVGTHNQGAVYVGGNNHAGATFISFTMNVGINPAPDPELDYGAIFLNGWGGGVIAVSGRGTDFEGRSLTFYCYVPAGTELYEQALNVLLAASDGEVTAERNESSSQCQSLSVVKSSTLTY